jgi:hypothetical protein
LAIIHPHRRPSHLRQPGVGGQEVGVLLVKFFPQELTMPCQNLQNELAELTQERSDLQQELSTAAPGAKSRLVAAIKSLNAQIIKKRHELDVCLGVGTTAKPLASAFTGTFTIRIAHPAVTKPITGVLSAGVVFSASRTSFTLNSLSPLSATFSTPLGPNTTVVSLIGPAAGSFDKNTGQIGLTLSLFFDQSIDLPILEEDSRLTLPMGTGAMGALMGQPMDGQGHAVLVGSAVMSGGFLNGSRTDLTIDGRFAPIP